MEDLLGLKDTSSTEFGTMKEQRELDSNEPKSEGKDYGNGISDSESNRNSLNLEDFEKVDADQLHQQMGHPNHPLPIPETHPGSEIVTDLLGSDSLGKPLEFSLSDEGNLTGVISHAPSGGENAGDAPSDLEPSGVRQSLFAGPPATQQGVSPEISMGDVATILEPKIPSQIGSELAYPLKGFASTEPTQPIEEPVTMVPNLLLKETTHVTKEPSGPREPIAPFKEPIPTKEPTPPREATYPPREPTPPPKVHTLPMSEPAPPPKEPTKPLKEPTPPPKEPTPPPKEPTPPPKEPTPPPKEPTPPPKEPTPPPKQPTPPPKEPTPPPKEPTPPPKEPSPLPTDSPLPLKEPIHLPKEPTPPPKEPTPPPKASSLPPRQPTPPPKKPTPLIEPKSIVTEKILGSSFVSSVKSSFPTVGPTSTGAPIGIPAQDSAISAAKDLKSRRSDLSSGDIPLAAKRSLGILQPLVNLIYWRDVKKSGIVFGSLMIILLSLAYLSLISVVAYVSLGVLTCNIAFRIYKNIMQAVQKSQDGHPFKEYLEMETNLQSDKVHEATDVIIAQVNSTVTVLKGIFFVQDLIDSIKFGCLLWCLTYLGAWFNGLTLVILFVVALFTLPKVYEQYQAQIDQYIELVMTQVNDVMTKVKATLPIGSKEKSQ